MINSINFPTNYFNASALYLFIPCLVPRNRNEIRARPNKIDRSRFRHESAISLIDRAK